MDTFIDVMPFWSIYGRFWSKKGRSNPEKKRFALKLQENVIKNPEIGRGGAIQTGPTPPLDDPPGPVFTSMVIEVA